MTEESDTKIKRLKLIAPEQCPHLGVSENPTPLGLTLRKTPSFLNLVESKLSYSTTFCSMKIKDMDTEAGMQQVSGKTKASNFCASSLRIGSWERVSRYDGELVCKCYFAKRKFVWEVLDCGLKKKIEVMWSDIASFKTDCSGDLNQTLEIELLRPPHFFCETNPQPRKHTLWKVTTDFTGGQASRFRRHILQVPGVTLRKHYGKLLQQDEILASLSKKPYPCLDSPFFHLNDMEHQNPNYHGLYGLESQNSILLEGLLESGTDDDYELLSHFIHSGTTNPLHYSDQDKRATSSDMGPPISGANASFLAHETSMSTVNMFPNVFVSLPSPMPSYSASNMSEGYSHVENGFNKIGEDFLGNDHGPQKLNLDPGVNVNSTLNFMSTCWISKVQTNQNLVGSFQDNGLKNDTDDYFGNFSYLGELQGDMWEELTSDKIREILEWP